MGKSYVSDITHFLDNVGELKEMPASVRRTAKFLTAIVDTETRHYPTIGHSTGIRCRKRGCKGSILASLQTADGKITWWCLFCKQNGVISDGMARSGTTRRSPHWVSGGPCPAIRPGKASTWPSSTITRSSTAQPVRARHADVLPRLPVGRACHGAETGKAGMHCREPGVPRSIRLLLKRDELPDLEWGALGQEEQP